MNMFLFICFIILIIFLIAAVLYMRLDWFKTLFHDGLKWHKPTIERTIKGLNVYSTCKHCNKPIVQDSQGNWYDPSDYFEWEEE